MSQTQTMMDAVAARDRSMDGVFFYAVLSTGIYCRPSCPSKRPRRENVVFFRAREAAERAGFRPCKRCKPEVTAAADPNAQLVEKVCRYIDAHPDEPVTLEALGRALGMSPFHLQRTFKARTGITPRGLRRFPADRLAQSRIASRTLGDALALRCRLRVLQQAVRARVVTTGNDARALSQARLRRDHSLHHRVHADRENAAGGDARKASARFSSEMRSRTLEHELRAEYPKAEIIRSDRKLGEQVKAPARDAFKENPAATLPLDIQATAFQRRVWRAAASDSARSHEILQQNRRRHRPSESSSRRRTRLRNQSGGGCDSVSSRGARRWRAWAAIAGAWNARRSCWRWKRQRRPGPGS